MYIVNVFSKISSVVGPNKNNPVFPTTSAEKLG
jgi:hypothetical protein